MMQCCPICFGYGKLSYPYGVAFGMGFSSGSTGPWDCHGCGGTGMIACASDAVSVYESTEVRTQLAELREAAKNMVRLHRDVGLICDNGVWSPDGRSEGAHWLGQAIDALEAALGEGKEEA